MFIETARLKSTLLSRKPSQAKLGATVLSIGLLCLASFLYWNLPGDSFKLFESSYESVFKKHQWVGLFLAPLAHADLHHLGSNLIFFSIFGFLLSNYFGKLVFPILSFAMAPVIQLITLAFYHNQTTLIGISGVVYWLTGTWIALFIGTERRLSVGRRLIASLGFFLAMMIPTHFEPNVSYLAHAVGFVLGLVSGGLIFTSKYKSIRQADRYETKVEWIEDELSVSSSGDDFDDTELADAVINDDTRQRRSLP